MIRATPLFFTLLSSVSSCAPAPLPASPPASASTAAPASTSTSPSPPSAAEAWARGRKAAREACHANDFATCRAQLLALYATSNSARLLLEIASVEAHTGDRAGAIDHLRAYAATGLSADLHEDSDLAGLLSDPAVAPIDARLRANRAPIANATLAFPLPHDELVTEGIAWDASSRTFLVSSVRKRKILAVDEHGAARDLVATGAGGVGALCGMASARDDVAKRDTLWVTMATMPPMVGFDASGPHPSALLAYDEHTGALLDRVDLPLRAGDERGHALTDVAVASNGDAFVSDALAGNVFVLPRGTHALQPLTRDGVFVSPQTAAPTPDGLRVFVPDYVLGLASIDRATHAVTWLHAKDTALQGIDDLHVVGASLVAIQNGTSPVRIVRFVMDASLTRIELTEVLEQEAPGLGEPTHGVVVDRTFWFLANAGWNRFDDDGTLARNAPADAPAMMRLALP